MGESASTEPELPELAAGELVVPMQPVDVVAWSGWFDGVLPVGPGVPPAPEFHSRGVLDLAWGEDYPTTLEVTLPAVGSYAFLCRGTASVESVLSASEGLDALPATTTSFALSVAGPGTYAARVTGTFVAAEGEPCFDHPPRMPFSIDVEVRVRRPTAVELPLPSVCALSPAPAIESTRRWAAAEVTGPTVLDETGQPFVPVNADPARPVTITARAGTDTGLGVLPDGGGIYDLVAVGASDRVEISALGRVVLELDLVDAAAIDEVDAGFALMGGKVDGGVVLESSKTYGAADWEEAGIVYRSIAVAVLGQRASGRDLCTVAGGDAFRLRSESPQRCPVFEGVGHGLSVPELGPIQFVLPHSAEVVDSGSCALRLAAPAYAGGAGWSADVSFGFDDVEMLAVGISR